MIVSEQEIDSVYMAIEMMVISTPFDDSLEEFSYIE